MSTYNIAWIIVGVFIFVTAYSKITIFVPILACAVLLTISGIGMGYLLNLNYKLYKKQTDSKRNLSYRYQVSENVRSFEMLIPMMTLLLLGCIVAMIVYALMMLLTDILLKAILGAFFNLIIAGGAIILPFVTMFSHRNLRRKILKALKKEHKNIKKIKRGRISSSMSDPTTIELKGVKQPISYIVVPMTLTGKRLIMETPDEATNVYFKQISVMWN
uniref:Uncharacterized protein n=1 Tax=Panagrolaimus davidi TaxID=227884 RepID=A0A914QS70_9BILA